MHKVLINSFLLSLLLMSPCFAQKVELIHIGTEDKPMPSFHFICCDSSERFSINESLCVAHIKEADFNSIAVFVDTLLQNTQKENPEIFFGKYKVIYNGKQVNLSSKSKSLNVFCEIESFLKDKYEVAKHVSLAKRRLR